MTRSANDDHIRDLVASLVRKHRRRSPVGWPGAGGGEHPTPSLDAMAALTGQRVPAERPGRSARRYRYALSASPAGIRTLVQQELSENVPEFDTVIRLALLGQAAGGKGREAQLAQSEFRMVDLLRVGAQTKVAPRSGRPLARSSSTGTARIPADIRPPIRPPSAATRLDPYLR